MKSRLHQESHAKDCFEIEEIWRICREETESMNFMRKKTDDRSTVNQLLSQIQDLRD